jgi:uncharacterized protein
MGRARVSGLKIARGLELPVEVAGESTAILAKKGAGKSNTAKVIVEEVLDHGGIQVVVFDPIGHWWSLRAGADGKPRGGYPVAVFGGMHGDLPLEETAGRLLAQTAVESGQSIVLDVSGLDSTGAMQRFVYEFLEELYKLKQATPTPLLLVLEEADEFAPQDPKGANVPRMVGAANRISKRGRGRGIGMLYVTQRSAALNKNVLDQADTLIVMRTIGPRDRAAIEGWVKHQDAAGMDQVLPSLPSLATGEAWIWNPERGLLERVKVRKARTFDSSETPKPGEAAIVANVKPIDVDALGEAIRATVERAKENDPAALRKRVRELERKLEEPAAAEPETHVETVVERVEVPVPVFNGEVDRLEDAVRALAQVGEQLRAAGDTVAQAATAISSAIATATRKESDARPHTATAQPTPPRAPRHQRADGAAHRVARPPAPAQDRPVRTEGISGPQQRILDALAALEAIGLNDAHKTQLALFAQASPKSSSYTNNLGALRTAGLIDYPTTGRVALTPGGRAIADAAGAPTSTEELHRFVFSLVGGAKTRLLEALIANYPGNLSKDDLAELAGASATSSSFTNNLGSLRSLGLIDYPAPGRVAALPILFFE